MFIVSNQEEESISAQTFKNVNIKISYIVIMIKSEACRYEKMSSAAIWDYFVCTCIS